MKMELSGVGFIDNQHYKLLEILTDAKAYATGSEVNKFVALLKFLGKLDEYSERHFIEEEQWMAAVGYTDIEKHKKTHKLFQAKVRHQIASLANLDENAIFELIEFAEWWLINHINTEAPEFKKYSSISV